MGVTTEKNWITKVGYKAEVIYINDFEHRCGYVGLEKGHYLYGIDYDDVYCCGFSVHGGITYSGIRQEDNLWHFGFDAAHSFDKSKFNSKGIARNLEYMVAECEKLAAQIFNYKNKSSEIYFEYLRSQKINIEDHNYMLMMFLNDDEFSKLYFEKLKTA